MFSIDTLHNRTRTPLQKMTFRTFFSDDKETNYTEDEPINKLWFKENFLQFHKDFYTKEIQNMNILHQLYFNTDEKKNESNNDDGNKGDDSDEHPLDILHIPIHPYIREVFLSDRILTTYEILGLDIFAPRNREDINRFCELSVETIRLLHVKNMVVSDVKPDLFTWDEKKRNIDTLSFSPMITNMMKPVNTDEQTLIMSRSIISPFHVLWDMLHSKYEAPMVEYKEFKKKFVIFWESIIKNRQTFQNLSNFCQTIYGKFKGEDYIDFIIIKFCVIDTQEGKHYVIKDPVKLKNNDYIQKLDWFALAIVIWSYYDNLGLDMLSSHFIFECISFDYTAV